LYKTLKEIGKIQHINFNAPYLFQMPKSPRKLKYPLTLTTTRTSEYQPFSTFCSAYLFNQSSFLFLQNSISPLIVEINSLSNLYNQRTSFEIDLSQILAPLSYWKKITDYAFTIYRSILNSISLLSPNVSKLIKFLIKFQFDVDYIFFECFINQALDNSAFLGSLPWHPNHIDWFPSRDVSDVFRCKFRKQVYSIRLNRLKAFISRFDSFQRIDFEKLYSEFLSHKFESFLLDEEDLLQVNNEFPKHLLIDGKALLILSNASNIFTKSCKSEKLNNLIHSLNKLPGSKEGIHEHFYFEISQSQKEATLSNSSSISLF
jgi:hypothetical protein